VWPATNAEAPRDGPDFEGGLSARDALGRCSASVDARPGRRGRRGGGAACPAFRQARRRAISTSSVRKRISPKF
jgi:hypothetical protein